MGISLSTARYLAPASFVIDFAAQQYGMLSTPNMKDVHDANLTFFSPQPYLIAAFFFTQQLVQLAWLWRLWRSRPAGQHPGPQPAAGPGGNADGDGVTSAMVDYTPFYALGNLCTAGWAVLWSASELEASGALVLASSLSQLYYALRRLPPMDPGSSRSVLTHAVSRSSAGVGVLDLLHNGSAAYFARQRGGPGPGAGAGAGPPPAVKVLTAVGFGGLAACSDWILGGCLVYDLVALTVGQRGYGDEGWGSLLGWYALGTAGIVAVKNITR